MTPEGHSRVTGIILAAGIAARMGRIKQLLPFNGRPVLQDVVDQARRAPLDQIVLVLGHAADEIRQELELEDVLVVINTQYPHGQSTSLRAGLAAVRPHMDAAMFILGDQPLVPAGVFEQLLDAHARVRSAFVIPTHGGRRGNPVLVDRAVFPHLAALTGDVGARVLFDLFHEQIQEVEIDSDTILLDLDTWDDYLRLQVRKGVDKSLQ